MNRRKVKRWFIDLGLLAGSCLFTFIIIEIILRIWFPQNLYMKVKERNYLLHHRLKPNYNGEIVTTEYSVNYSINSLGLRNYEFAVEKSKNTYRILMLGDSYTEGFGVNIEFTVSKILERMLNSHIKNGVEFQVINAGVAGYSPILEYLYLKYEGLSLKPDMVILNFDMTDIHDDYIYTKCAKFDKEGKPIAVVHPFIDRDTLAPLIPLTVKDFLKGHSHFYVFVTTLIHKIHGSPFYSGTGDIETDIYFYIKKGVKWESHWKRTAKYLKLINGLLKENNIKFMLTTYPHKLFVEADGWHRIKNLYKIDTDEVESLEFFNKISKFGKDNNIKVLNMVKQFKNNSKVASLFYEKDRHWNANGHALAARLIFDKLLETQLIPGIN